jgi:hypothetical protein
VACSQRFAVTHGVRPFEEISKTPSDFRRGMEANRKEVHGKIVVRKRFAGK